MQFLHFPEQQENGKNEDTCSGTELSLPIDIIIEILSRLPLKSVLRFKCVCNLWRAISQERKFVKKHMMRSKGVYEYKNDTSLRWIFVSDGLVLEASTELTIRYRIRNPATKQIVDLPDPHRKSSYMRFSYSSTINNYKLFSVYCNEGTKCGGFEVLTLGDSAWRAIDIPGFCNLGSTETERSICKIIDDLIFAARISLSERAVLELSYLEMESEHFGTVKVPKSFCKDWNNVSLFSWEDKKLSLARMENQKLQVWVLEDYKKQQWAERDIIIPLTFLNKYPDLPADLKPQVVTNGWLFFGLSEKHHVVYNIESRKEFIEPAPTGKTFNCCYYPSLVVLEGSRREV